MSRKNPFVRSVGRPPAPTSAFGKARPKRPPKNAISSGPTLGAGLSAAPGSTATPMDGFSGALPTSSFKRGGEFGHKRMASYHDDHRLSKRG